MHNFNIMEKIILLKSVTKNLIEIENNFKNSREACNTDLCKGKFY